MRESAELRQIRAARTGGAAHGACTAPDASPLLHDCVAASAALGAAELVCADSHRTHPNIFPCLAPVPQDGGRPVQLRARAGAINKAITVAEIAKRALPGVHQTTMAALEVRPGASMQDNRYESAVRRSGACNLPASLLPHCNAKLPAIPVCARLCDAGDQDPLFASRWWSTRRLRQK